VDLSIRLQGKPVVVIGNNEVRGEIVTLKTPLCVMKKKEQGEKMQDETYAGIVELSYVHNRNTSPKSLIHTIDTYINKILQNIASWEL
jgi:hypothetical protein